MQIITDTEALRIYQANVTALERQIVRVYKPQTEADVAQIILEANDTALPLYPISRGKNWGLGSKLPVEDKCAVVDLSEMDRIIAVDEVGCYAIIEPGVTQAMLADYLQRHHPRFLINATGSYAHTSVAGNIIERGDAIYAERAEDLLGARGILGNGKLFAVGGFWSIDEGPTHFFRHGIGPDMRGLFGQSSFGIVTQMVVKLVPRPEAVCLLWAEVPQQNLGRVVDTLDYLCRQNVLVRNNTRLGYVNRFEHFAEAVDQAAGNIKEHVWSVYAILSGTERMVEVVLGETLDALHSLAPAVGVVNIWNAENIYEKVPQVLHPLIGLLNGEPDSMSIQIIYEELGLDIPDDDRDMDPDLTSFGMKSYLPVIPISGADMNRAVKLIDEVSREFGFPLQLSCDLNGRGILTVNFRRDNPTQTQHAHECVQELGKRMITAGFPPHRMSIDQMVWFAEVNPEAAELVAQLKSVLDPNGIIAPGRYS